MASYATFSTLSTAERFNNSYYKWSKPATSIKDFVRRYSDGKEKLPAIIKMEMTTDNKRKARSNGLLAAGDIVWVCGVRKQKRAVIKTSASHLSLPLDSNLLFTMKGTDDLQLTLGQLLAKNKTPVEVHIQTDDEHMPHEDDPLQEVQKELSEECTLLCEYTHIYLITCAITHHCMSHTLTQFPCFLPGQVKRAKMRADGNKEFWRQHLDMCTAIVGDMDTESFHDTGIYKYPLSSCPKSASDWSILLPTNRISVSAKVNSAEFEEEVQYMADTYAVESGTLSSTGSSTTDSLSKTSTTKSSTSNTSLSRESSQAAESLPKCSLEPSTVLEKENNIDSEIAIDNAFEHNTSREDVTHDMIGDMHKEKQDLKMQVENSIKHIDSVLSGEPLTNQSNQNSIGISIPQLVVQEKTHQPVTVTQLQKALESIQADSDKSHRFHVPIPSNHRENFSPRQVKRRMKIRASACELTGWKQIDENRKSLVLNTGGSTGSSNKSSPSSTLEKSEAEGSVTRKERLPVFIRRENSKRTVRRSTVKKNDHSLKSIFQYSADIELDDVEPLSMESIIGSSSGGILVEDLSTFQLIQCLKLIQLDFLVPVFNKHRIDGNLLKVLGPTGMEKHFNVEPVFTKTLVDYVSRYCKETPDKIDPPDKNHIDITHYI